MNSIDQPPTAAHVQSGLDTAFRRVCEAEDRLELADCAVAEAQAAKVAAAQEVARAQQEMEGWVSAKIADLRGGKHALLGPPAGH